MAKKELFLKRTYEIVNELKIPLIDERVYKNINLNESRCTVVLTFEFDEDESVIRGFLGLAEYFHTVVIKQKEKFLIPNSTTLFILQSK
jgi:ssRNA-specific RNase YbeY (16S rRNA maturation enzyme)